MNLLHLQYFHAVAREGGFSKASQLLKVDQSALSRMVKQFEDSLNLNLLERQPRGVKLTPAGEKVFLRAEEIFRQVQALREETGQIHKICEGELRLISTDAIAVYLLAPAVDEVTRAWPKLYPVVQTGSSGEALPKIANGRFEFGIFFHLQELPDSLAVTRRWPVRFRLVAAAVHAKNKSTLAKFIGSREVDDVLNRRFPTLEKWQRQMPEAKISISSNSLLSHAELVKKGAGISVLPDFLVQKELAKGKLVDLMPRENLIFEMKLVQRKNVGLTFNAETLLVALSKGFNPLAD